MKTMKIKMTRSVILTICCWLMTGSVALSQQAATAPAPAPAPNPLQIDQKNLNDAMRIKDPQKRIAALEAAIPKMSPQGVFGMMGALALVENLAKHMPAQTDRIRGEIVKILESRGGPHVYLAAARKLLDAGIMLDYAEELSRKALALFEEEAAAEINQQRAKFLSALGLIYLKEGKTKEAEKLLKEVVEKDKAKGPSAAGLNRFVEETLVQWGNNARQAEVAMALAGTAEKKGDLKTALNYLADAGMLVPLKGPDRKRLEDLYRKTHDNSLDGLEEMLDEKYLKANAATFAVQPYKATEKRGDRVALAEFFTGSGCGPCVAADMAFDAMLKRYSRRELALLVYHLHIPLPDPMTNPAAIARGKFYGVNSTPSHLIDGNKKTGGGDRSQARAFYTANQTAVDERLNVPSEAEIDLSAVMENGLIKTRVAVDKIKGESADLRLQIALVENELSYTGENGVRIHPMVVRYLAGEDFNGFALPAGKASTVEHSFDLARIGAELQAYIDNYVKNPPERLADEGINFSKPMYQIKPDHLSVVAFIQDAKTKQVLQATSVSLAARGEK